MLIDSSEKKTSQVVDKELKFSGKFVNNSRNVISDSFSGINYQRHEIFCSLQNISLKSIVREIFCYFCFVQRCGKKDESEIHSKLRN